MRLTKISVWLLLFVLTFFLVSNKAAAYGDDGPGSEPRYPDEWATVCMVNESQHRITCCIKWIDNSWQTFSIQPGGYQISYAHIYPPGNYNLPKQTIGFYSNVVTGAGQFKQYTLNHYIRPNTKCEGTKQYGFRYTNASKMWIDLVNR